MTGKDIDCCAKRPAGESPTAPAAITIAPSKTPIARRWSPLIGGSFRMGSSDKRFPDDGEGPVRNVTVTMFAIACHAVSNLQFGDFVRQTGYLTDAERCGWSFVFEGLLSDDALRTSSRAAETPWWVARGPRSQHDGPYGPALLRVPAGSSLPQV
jgi:sulfatase modifying factor 1